MGLPPADEQFLDKQALMEIASRYNQEFCWSTAAAEGLTLGPSQSLTSLPGPRKLAPY